ncbi:MAG: glycogen debranching enzyme [Gammaproteobacteria bacterium]|nr:MAG: glycogen debranching enzyme [Gammaproteobacteria bacterium]
MNNWEALEGSPRPMGVSFVASQQAWNFALYSKHASAVTLHLYQQSDTENPVYSYQFKPLLNKSGRVWHCRISVAAAASAHYYAYQVNGPVNPAQGQRFDSEKTLLDPYARAVHFPSGFDRLAAIGPGANAGKAPLGLIPINHGNNTQPETQKPQHTHDAVIYELHVKGFTRHTSSAIDTAKRGTFSGLAKKIPYLKSLGITVVELMPVFQFDPQENDYWGYMPLSFFAPHHLYGQTDSPAALLDEFRAMVKAFHQADIEVVLDVVFNHTGEGNENGPTYSFRGIDNTTYYLLENDHRRYHNDAGTGNVLHTANRHVRSMVLDSLRYWVNEMHVDGFRFDLASIFTRSSDGSVNLEDAPIISAIRSDPDLANIRLIAEAWDISSYQLGRSFPGISWQQWNGQFPDDVRRFIRADCGMINSLMQRLYGSDDLFPDSLMDAYHPYQSVNYITSHDGFTLYDLVAYNHKHNETNGHGNSDGTDCNYSWNCGWEGDNAVPDAVMRLRKRQIKNFCCLLLLANGTPMIRAGDEFMQTQSGNNNPYNQDNDISWLNWKLLDTNQDIFCFFQKMIAFRKAHPSLGRSRFWRDDVQWFGVGPEVDRSDNSHSLAYYLNGASQDDQDIYVMINAWHNDLVFTIRQDSINGWQRVIDTARESPHDIAEPGQEMPLHGLSYNVKARSVVVLLK